MHTGRLAWCVTLLLVWLVVACTPTTTSSSLYFPRQSDTSPDTMNALLTGDLIVEDNCLRVRASDTTTSHLLIWPFGYTLNESSSSIEVLNQKDAVVATVGLPVTVAGGERNVADSVVGEAQFREQYGVQCPGPYWIVSAVSPP